MNLFFSIFIFFLYGNNFNESFIFKKIFSNYNQKNKFQLKMNNDNIYEIYNNYLKNYKNDDLNYENNINGFTYFSKSIEKKNNFNIFKKNYLKNAE